MITNIDLSYNPIFNEKEHSWIQLIPFQYKEKKVEIDVFFSYIDDEWELSPVYSNNGLFKTPELEKSPEILTEMLESDRLNLFLSNRKQFYKEYKKILDLNQFFLYDMFYLANSEDEKTLCFKIKGCDIVWTAFYLKTFNWHLSSIQSEFYDEFIRDISDIVPFKSELEKMFKKEMV